jgi:hypothetical protein
MRILTINSTLAPYFPDTCQVKNLDLSGGIVDLSKIRDVKEFNPDLIFQQENLGPRTLLFGLSEFYCKKVFWSIDTHLNFFWHKIYGKNFDLLLTTQPSFVSLFKKENISSDCLMWYGLPLNWNAWESRKHSIGFAGRVNEYRTLRKVLVDFLKKEFSSHFVHQELPFTQMLNFYQQTKIVVNEAIAGEINFRTFEALSCGCLLFSPGLKEDLREFFEPEKEYVEYRDGLELKEKLHYFLNHPQEASLIARRGWEKLRANHLAPARVQKLLALAQNLEAKETLAAEEKSRVIASFFLLKENNNFPEEDRDLENILLAGYKNAEIYCCLLELNLQHRNKLEEILYYLLKKGLYEEDWELNLCASFAALFWKNRELARKFIVRYVKSNSLYKDIPKKIRDMILFWAKELIRRKQKFRIGFLFDPNKHLPRSAAECLYLLLLNNPADEDALKLLKTLLREQKGVEDKLLQLESQLSLLHPEDWRLGLDLAETNLKNFRIQEAREEFLLAWQKAREQKKEQEFWLRVKGKRGIARLVPGGRYA